jgi:hypothetical protein
MCTASGASTLHRCHTVRLKVGSISQHAVVTLIFTQVSTNSKLASFALQSFAAAAEVEYDCDCSAPTQDLLSLGKP